MQEWSRRTESGRVEVVERAVGGEQKAVSSTASSSRRLRQQFEVYGRNEAGAQVKMTPTEYQPIKRWSILAPPLRERKRERETKTR